MTKWNKDIPQKVYEIAREDEYTQPEIAAMLGITVSTFHEWKNDPQKSEFSEALKKAEQERLQKFVKIGRVSLLKKLEGFEYEEVTQEGTADKDGRLKPKSIRKVKKWVPPDTTAIIFTLKNLDSVNFPDKQKHDHTSGGEKISFLGFLMQTNVADESNGDD